MDLKLIYISDKNAKSSIFQKKKFYKLNFYSETHGAQRGAVTILCSIYLKQMEYLSATKIQMTTLFYF